VLPRIHSPGSECAIVELIILRTGVHTDRRFGSVYVAKSSPKVQLYPSPFCTIIRDMADPSDRDLVLRTRRGEVEAFGELVRRYQTSVFNVCYRLLGERREAEDLAQESFIRAFQRLDTFDIDRPFGPWVRRVAANLCLNYLQRFAPPHLPLDDEGNARLQATWADPEATRERAERAEALRAAILALPAPYRAVVELRHFQELSYAEISAELSIPLSDVKSHLFRARKQLARMLKPDA